MNIFYENFLYLCAKFNKTPSGVAAAVGLSNAAASGWKNGKKPSQTTLAKLASYFGVTVEELLSEDENKPAPNDGNELTDTQREALDLIQEMSEDQLRVFIATLKAARGE